MKVEDLAEREEYQFRVKAVNKAGPSQPSEATDWHLVKHRKREEHWDGSHSVRSRIVIVFGFVLFILLCIIFVGLRPFQIAQTIARLWDVG